MPPKTTSAPADSAARAGAQAINALTLNPDHPMGLISCPLPLASFAISEPTAKDRANPSSRNDYLLDSTSITKDSGATPSNAIASAAALLFIAAIMAPMSGTSISTATRVGF